MSEGKVRESTLKLIEDTINTLYAENPAGFKLTKSLLHQRSGVSRPTLNKEDVQKHIEDCIGRLKEDHKLEFTTKERRSENKRLIAENHRLKKSNKKLQIQNQSLLTSFSDLFYRIYGESVDPKKLIPEALEDGQENEE